MMNGCQRCKETHGAGYGQGWGLTVWDLMTRSHVSHASVKDGSTISGWCGVPHKGDSRIR